MTWTDFDTAAVNSLFFLGRQLVFTVQAVTVSPQAVVTPRGPAQLGGVFQQGKSFLGRRQRGLLALNLDQEKVQLVKFVLQGIALFRQR